MPSRPIPQQRAAQAERARQAVEPGADSVGFLRFAVSVGGRDYVRDLEIEAHVDTDPIGLSQALADLPGLVAFYATAEAEARAEAKRAEVRRSKLHAERYTYLEASQARTDDKGKRAKPTVDAIKSLILKDPQYQQAQEQLINAELQLDRCTAGKLTINVKKDVTLAIASNYRAELDAHMHDALRSTQQRHAAAIAGTGPVR